MEVSRAQSQRVETNRALGFAAADDGYHHDPHEESRDEYLYRVRRDALDALEDALDRPEPSHDPEPRVPLLGVAVREAVRHAMHHSARSEQSADRRLGPSELGGCRAYLAHVIAGTEFDQTYSDDTKWAAFVGTAVGDMIEVELVRTDPDRYTNQVSVTATLPRLDVKVSGHIDILESGEGIGDIKSKDGLALVRRTGPSFKELAQVNIYLLGAIQSGLVPEDAIWSLVYVDRSGREDEPHVVSGTLDMDVIAQVEQRLEDAVYAARYDMDSAPRDEPYDRCKAICPFFSSCRGADEHQTAGLITDEKYLDAVAAYREAMDTIREAEKIKDEAKQVLAGVSGSTGQYLVSWTQVGMTDVPAHTRPGYARLSLRKVPAKKAPKAPATGTGA